MTTINKLRRACYTIARVLGDIQAIRKGPKAIVKRIGRKWIYRQVGKRLP